MNKVMTLTFASSLSNLTEINSSFDSGVLQVAYPGENRNGSFISKDTFERCIKTMYNCPIVAHYDRDAGTFGGHDMEVVSNDNGDLRIVNLTTPIGVIPESAKHWWSAVTEDDGTTREYLFTECLIWKRQEEYQALKTEKDISHSMEISVKSGEVIDGVYHIYDFEFTAFAIIGVEPCFESSALHMFTAADFKKQVNQMMQDLKDTFTLVTPSNEVDITHPQKISTEGGERVLDEKMELIAKYGVDIDSLDFSIEDCTIEELKEKLEAFSHNQEEDNSAQGAEVENFEQEDAETNNEDTPSSDEDFALNSNIASEIHRSFDDIVIETEWGTFPRYCVADFDTEVSEVYCWDSEDWLLYGFKYSEDGDAIRVDFDSKHRVKYIIADFDEGEQESPFAQMFSVMKEKIHSDVELEAKYQTASDTIASLNTEIEDLRKFKKGAEDAAALAARSELFSNFEDLSGIEAFEELKNNCLDYDLDTLEEKCFAIRGRNGVAIKFSSDSKKPKLVVDKTNDSAEPYNGVFEEFGFKAEN